MPEMKNQRRRFEKEKEEAFEYGGYSFAKEALNLIDNLDRSKHVLETDESIDARWDTGIEQGSVIGTDFDPMLAKVIAKGKNRTDAANKLALALQSLHIGGVTTNRDFLVASLRSKQFHKGQTTSDFIEKAKPQRSVILKDQQLEQAVTAAALWIQGENRNNASLLKEAPSGWRNSRVTERYKNLPTSSPNP